jgi:hypothetical protein
VNDAGRRLGNIGLRPIGVGQAERATQRHNDQQAVTKRATSPVLFCEQHGDSPVSKGVVEPAGSGRVPIGSMPKPSLQGTGRDVKNLGAGERIARQ